MLYENQKIVTPKYIIDIDRKLRQNLTPSEKIIWSQLRYKQLENCRFRCQHPIFRYILDFYCHQAKLAIEIDGEIHKSQFEYDNYRDEFLKNIGITTLRFTVNDVMTKNKEVINSIQYELKIRKS